MTTSFQRTHHSTMINSEELHRTLRRQFYEVPDGSSLKYGDILVFYDRPSRWQRAPAQARWIRHAAVYLFDKYLFSKGSKSANSIYSVKTLATEWRFWEQKSTDMAIKVFRRTHKNVRNQPPRSLKDWIY